MADRLTPDSPRTPVPPGLDALRGGTTPHSSRAGSAGLDRRGFLASSALAAGAYGLLAGCASESSGPQAKGSGEAPKEVFTSPATKLSGSLSILMWSHFVPRHDTWFDKFVADWGKKVGVDVRVDHVNTVDVPRRAASEIQAKRGHDLIQHIAPLSQYEPSVLDMADVVQEANKRWGQQQELCRKSSYNPNTEKFYAYCPGWTPDPGDFRRSMWQKVGMPNGPASWDDLLRGASEIKKQTGVPCGIGLSPETDSNMAARALLWSFGGSVQDENEQVAINSDATIAAVEYMTRLFKEAETSEVFSWNPASNNQALIAGKSSYILNSISAWRTAMSTNREIGDDIFFVPALRGPKAALAAQHVIQQWIVPTYAGNADAAKEFLLHYTANFPAVDVPLRDVRPAGVAVARPAAERLAGRRPVGRQAREQAELPEGLRLVERQHRLPGPVQPGGRRDLQHPRPADDVRPRRPRPGVPEGRRRRGRGIDQEDLRQLALPRPHRRLSPTPSSREAQPWKLSK